MIGSAAYYRPAQGRGWRRFRSTPCRLWSWCKRGLSRKKVVCNVWCKRAKDVLKLMGTVAVCAVAGFALLLAAYALPVAPMVSNMEPSRLHH